MSEPLFLDFIHGESALGICGTPSSMSSSAIESRLVSYFSDRRIPNLVYIFGCKSEAQKLRTIFKKDTVANRLAGLSGKPRLIPILLDEHSGRMEAYKDDWESLVTDPLNLQSLRQASMQAIFRKYDGMLYGHEGHHYEKPSGKHSDKFIRAANVLHDSSAVRLLSLWLAELIPESCNCIYSDTSSIHPIIFQSLINRFPCSPKLQQISIDTFRSYEGLDSYSFRDPKRSAIFISASTSGDLVQKLVSHNRIAKDGIHTLFYLGDPEAAGHVMCNLTKTANENPSGYEKIKSFSKEHCPLCKAHSQVTTIVGDQFLTEKPRVSTYTIVAMDAPGWLRDTMNEFAQSDIFRVQRTISGKSATQTLSIDPASVLENPSYERFQQHLRQSFGKVVPASTRNVIHIGGPAAAILASQIVTHIKNCGVTEIPKVISANDFETLSAELTQGTTVVVTDVMSTGRNFQAVNRLLRNNHSQEGVVYFAAFVACESKNHYDEIVRNLTWSGQRGAGAFSFEFVRRCYLPRQSTYLPWEREYSAHKSLRNYCTENEIEFPSILVERISALEKGSGQGLVDKVFLSARPLHLRKDFAFFETGPEPSKVRQSSVLATVGIVLNSLRNNSKSGRRLYSELNHMTLLSPTNFDRFNDGIIQASLLRSALPRELAYAQDQNISELMLDIMREIFCAWNTDQGEAGFEFIVALLTKSLTLYPPHARDIADLLSLSKESTGVYCLAGRYLRSCFG